MGKFAITGFLVILAGIGFTMLIGLVVPSVYYFWRTSDKVTTPASLIEVSTIQHQVRGGERIETVVRYRYQVGGRWYEGDRVSIFRFTDQFHTELKEALDEKREIRVYIDPKNPRYSVYDREFSRWPFSGGVIMGVTFIAIGLHGLWWQRRTSSSPRVRR